MLKISDEELESYSVGDYSNIIGDLLEDAEFDIIKLFVESRELTQEDFLKLNELEITELDYHFESDESSMINWKFEDSLPSEIVGYKISDDENMVELSDGFYYFY